MIPITSIYSKYDHIVEIKALWKLEKINETKKPSAETSDSTESSDVVKAVTDLLTKALSDRISAIDHIEDDSRLRFGILLNTDHAYEPLIKGPSGDSKDAVAFREFWGSVSELRRFQDASICESVMFETKSISDRRALTGKIIKHVLKEQFNLNEKDVNVTGNEVNSLLTGSEKSSYGTGEEAQALAISAYDELVKKLRSLTDLPLTISGHQGISALFRGTEVSPQPEASVHPEWRYVKKNDRNQLCFRDTYDQDVMSSIKPQEIIVHLEASGKWPDKVDALRRVKAALVVELAKQLTTKFAFPCKVAVGHVDVFSEGFLFRLTLAVRKEIQLLRHQVTTDNYRKSVVSHVADALEEKNELLTKLSSALYGLHQKHLNFGATCRLAKKWIASHYMSGYLDEIVIDLIVAYLYISPHPLTVPNSPLTGFVRFLDFLATYDFTKSAIIVNFNQQLKTDKMNEIKTQFSINRKTLPTIFIATPFDKKLSQFTRAKGFVNSPQILLNAKSLALKSRDLLVGQLEAMNCKDNIKSLFEHSLESYDVVVELLAFKKSVDLDDLENVKEKKKMKKKRKKSKSLQSETSLKNVLPIVDFDAVTNYLSILRSNFGHFSLFFYNEYQPTHIGVKFNGEALAARKFDETSASCKMFSETVSGDGKEMCEVNMEAVIEDFKILGSGVVKRITMKSEMAC
ncbi:Nucleolar protein 6 [Halotydeus destructor]|nr:Nucleolar protein 6 [Halotydeus destructor]